MRIVVAEHDTNLRAELCVWLAHMNSVELAGVARSRLELMPALCESNAAVVVLAWELAAVDFEAVVAELHRLRPIPKAIISDNHPQNSFDSSVTR